MRGFLFVRQCVAWTHIWGITHSGGVCETEKDVVILQIVNVFLQSCVTMGHCLIQSLNRGASQKFNRYNLHIWS